MKVSDVINRAYGILKDDGTRWINEKMFVWLQDGSTELINAQPTASAKTRLLSLGMSTQQELPNEYAKLIRIERTESDKAIRRVSRYVQNSFNPTWGAFSKPKEVSEYWIDETSDRVFYVNPQPKSGDKVSVVVALRQAEIKSLDDELVVLEEYRSALVDYVLYRAYGMDAEHGDNNTLSNTKYASFARSAGIKQDKESKLPVDVISGRDNDR